MKPDVQVSKIDRWSQATRRSRDHRRQPGIGAATPIRLARAGHHLAVAYRDDGAAAERLAAAVTAEGVRCVTVRTDVAREEDVDQLFTIATQRLGTVTGLVNNAGLTAHIGDLIDTPVQVIRRVIEVNLVGVVLCARRAAQLMSVRRAGGGGAIGSGVVARAHCARAPAVSAAGPTNGSQQPTSRSVK